MNKKNQKATGQKAATPAASKKQAARSQGEMRGNPAQPGPLFAYINRQGM